MSSIFDILVELPLFKGGSIESITNFIARTPIDFINFSENEIICKAGDNMNALLSLISGEIKCDMEILNHSVKISQYMAKGTVVYPEYLFGWNNTCPVKIVATSNASLLRIAKENYMTLLQEDKIFMVNYLNYLAYRAQKRIDSIKEIPDIGFANFIRIISTSCTERGAGRIEISISENKICKLLHITKLELANNIAILEKENILRKNGSKLIILNRKDYL